MANIYSEDYIFKYGQLVQYGTSYMQGFSSFADDFHNTRNSFQDELNNYGYSINWVNWQKQNSQSIIDLYDQLNAQGLIPTQPV